MVSIARGKGAARLACCFTVLDSVLVLLFTCARNTRAPAGQTAIYITLAYSGAVVGLAPRLRIALYTPMPPSLLVRGWRACSALAIHRCRSRPVNKILSLATVRVWFAFCLSVLYAVLVAPLARVFACKARQAWACRRCSRICIHVLASPASHCCRSGCGCRCHCRCCGICFNLNACDQCFLVVLGAFFPDVAVSRRSITDVSVAAHAVVAVHASCLLIVSTFRRARIGTELIGNLVELATSRPSGIAIHSDCCRCSSSC